MVCCLAVKQVVASDQDVPVLDVQGDYRDLWETLESFGDLVWTHFVNLIEHLESVVAELFCSAHLAVAVSVDGCSCCNVDEGRGLLLAADSNRSTAADRSLGRIADRDFGHIADHSHHHTVDYSMDLDCHSSGDKLGDHLYYGGLEVAEAIDRAA